MVDRAWFESYGQSKQPPIYESVPYITSGTRFQFRFPCPWLGNWPLSGYKLIVAQKDSCVKFTGNLVYGIVCTEVLV